MFDLQELVAPRQFDLSLQRDCKDGYLTSVQSLVGQVTCSDRIDNDVDGLVDSADPDCVLTGVEAENEKCPQTPECVDGYDNDADGLVDAEDPDCDEQSRWEGGVPACSDSVDNDGDGRVDREDPGCSSEADPSEGDLEVGDTCTNGEDDDADGLVDEDDPGCTDPDAAAVRYWQERVPECGDGIDNDGDGLIDYGPDGDPDCYAAGDRVEGSSRLELGPSFLDLVTMAYPEGYRTLLYAVDPGGALGRSISKASVLRFAELRYQTGSNRRPLDDCRVTNPWW